MGKILILGGLLLLLSPSRKLIKQDTLKVHNKVATQHVISVSKDKASTVTQKKKADNENTKNR